MVLHPVLDSVLVVDIQRGRNFEVAGGLKKGWYLEVAGSLFFIIDLEIGIWR